LNFSDTLENMSYLKKICCAFIIMSNTKDFILNQVMWIGLSIGIGLLISFFVPFPYSLIFIVIVIFFVAYYFIRRRIVWDRNRY